MMKRKRSLKHRGSSRSMDLRQLKENSTEKRERERERKEGCSLEILRSDTEREARGVEVNGASFPSGLSSCPTAGFGRNS